MKITSDQITQENFPLAVKVVLQECNSLHDEASVSTLIRDLEVAINSLQLITNELDNISLRPRHQRSASFTRYIIDEESQTAIDEELKKKVVKIENIYKRY